jgi:hypothetical protein
MTTTVRISVEARDLLKAFARSSGRSIQEVLEEAIELYRRQVFLDQVNAGYARLRQDEVAWVAEQKDRSAWNGTLGDGLNGD